MGSKIGLILCLPFMFIAFLFGIDLIFIQLTYTSLDSISTTVSYRISKTGTVDEELKSFVKREVNGTIEPAGPLEVYIQGETYSYYLIKEYKPIALQSNTLKLKLKRYAVISFYN